MCDDINSHGGRIRALFETAANNVVVIAPFIKVNALRSLLSVVSPNTHFRCVTRWLPREVAAGVSDPEILEILEERGNFNLSLVDRLHAKLYIAGERCLAGSANVTLAGLGEGVEDKNIEVLVETTTSDPGIATTLAEISKEERPATSILAKTARRLADSISASTKSVIDFDEHWFPGSRRPEHAYQLYTHTPNGYISAADAILLSDLARSNIQPGLEKKEFHAAVRSLLAVNPFAATLLEENNDTTLTRADAQPYFETLAEKDFSANDLWLAFVNWMAYFFSDKVMIQEVTEIALRRAQLLDISEQ